MHFSNLLVVDANKRLTAEQVLDSLSNALFRINLITPLKEEYHVSLQKIMLFKNGQGNFQLFLGRSFLGYQGRK
jgi:hypothetical protein